MCHEGDEPFLESAEASFNLAFGLGRGRHEMGDLQGAQSALELALRVAVIVAGTRAEKAQSVGIDDLWQAVAFECVAKVQEVVPCGIALNEASRHAES